MILLNIVTHPHKEYEGSIRMGAAHSLIIGHGPKLNLITAEQEADNRRSNLESFGLWEVATPNFNTYYPNATAEDLAPKDEEFIRPIYRALSEVIVRKKFDPIDFSKNGVLKASMSMLVGQSVYTNHDSFVGNEVGVVSKTFWAEAYEVNGQTIPAGINAEFLIDGKAHPKLSRGIMMDPPSIHSNSVTVNFKWIQSHPKMEYQEFRNKVGSYDEKGQLIRRIVSEITAYYETSLVSHGADPFAQKVGNDGKIVNPDLAIRRDSFSAEKEGASLYHFFSYKESLSEITIPVQLDNNNNSEKSEETPKSKTMNKELVLLMALLSGYQLAEGLENLSQEEFSEQFDEAAFLAHVTEKKAELEALKTASTELTAITTEKEALEAEIEPLREFKTQNEKIAEKFGEVRSSLQAEVERLYSIAHGKPASDKLRETFTGATFETLETFKESYYELVEDKYEMTCNDCNSHNITRASSNPEGLGDNPTTPVVTTPPTDAELYYKIRKRKTGRKDN